MYVNTCKLCLDDLVQTNKTIVDDIVYKYCIECMCELKKTQSFGYIKSLKYATCESDLKDLLRKGLCGYINDQNDVIKVYYDADGIEYSGELLCNLSAYDRKRLNNKLNDLYERMCVNPIDYVGELVIILKSFGY